MGVTIPTLAELFERLAVTLGKLPSASHPPVLLTLLLNEALAAYQPEERARAKYEVCKSLLADVTPDWYAALTGKETPVQEQILLVKFAAERAKALGL